VLFDCLIDDALASPASRIATGSGGWNLGEGHVTNFFERRVSAYQVGGTGEVILDAAF
jgi:hypothetical protein